MRIVQMSDIHVGTFLFRPELFTTAVIEETNTLGPDLVVVAGDTMEGYRWEFEEAKGYLDRIECPNMVVAMGSDDARSVGYRHFEELFGMREGTRVVAVPEGEVGREHYAWLDAEFRGWGYGDRRYSSFTTTSWPSRAGRGRLGWIWSSPGTATSRTASW